MQHQVNFIKQSFDPLSLDLEFFHDFSDESSVTLNGDFISQIDDLTVNGNDLANATGGEQPDYTTDTIDGQKAGAFDGSDDYLFKDAVTIPASGDVTFFAVAEISAVSGNQKSLYSGADGSDDFQFQNSTAGTNFRAALNGPNATTALALSDLLGPALYTCIFDFTGAGTYRVQYNGVDVNSGSAYTTEVAPVMDFKLAVNTNMGAFLPCVIGADACLKNADADDITALTDYFMNRWNL